MDREYEVAFKSALDIVQSDLDCVERWQLADLYLTLAGLHWRQRKFAKSLLAAMHAVVIRPTVVARPLKPVLRRFGLVRGTATR